jgi:predicted 3-demethylubiquinone-9 3-methyltransferase (glyoxalase superfamily)
MTNSIGICLWFDTQAKDAGQFYQSVFKGFAPISENPLAVVYSLYGRRFMNLNGNTNSKMNPSISFFVQLNQEDELMETWNKLIVGGSVLMPLDTYPWSKKYGWCADQFGVNWQLILTEDSTDVIIPSMMFIQENNGKAQEAIDFYTALFKETGPLTIDRYQKGEGDTEGNIKYSRFNMGMLPFGAMDSGHPHAFNFNDSISFVLTVDSQDEIDFYWNALTEKGQGGRCGWLKDPFGVSWQIVPSILGKLMSNPATAPKATYAFLQMSKFIIADLEKAAHS